MRRVVQSVHRKSKIQNTERKYDDVLFIFLSQFTCNLARLRTQPNWLKNQLILMCPCSMTQGGMRVEELYSSKRGFCYCVFPASYHHHHGGLKL